MTTEEKLEFIQRFLKSHRQADTLSIAEYYHVFIRGLLAMSGVDGSVSHKDITRIGKENDDIFETKKNLPRYKEFV